jgi:hypothetical protein
MFKKYNMKFKEDKAHSFVVEDDDFTETISLHNEIDINFDYNKITKIIFKEIIKLYEKKGLNVAANIVALMAKHNSRYKNILEDIEEYKKYSNQVEKYLLLK